MTERDFVSAFEQRKELFIRQVMPGDNNRKALDLFEKWLKGKLEHKKKPQKSQVNKKEFGLLLDSIVKEAESRLAGKGIYASCVSSIVPGNRSNSRCIRVKHLDSIYYRICKTSPRKGKHSGKNLLAVELIMDGNKNNIFLPLLFEKANMEKELGMEIERERQTIEATGKYRFKILFDLDEYEEKAIARQLGEAMAKFMLVTWNYLNQIINNNN
ncbi:hypothetical protein SAMN05660649_02294 [Desulfotomaculum arcticum]|uniref:Uncharacterized protein n=1 Tax=Desulfotruncus arcticus DSM 17038 TaxID=1121424 RepID=A0A1I2TJB2_9FIRM|nr:hypothetical protein [Desulfotruncus arcticus]SFG65005.1 hypothetical protein SAMN05660649_02294 [Desulfotomaculum arcticum] [Desulfotruncus arcticus DSM 17038]